MRRRDSGIVRDGGRRQLRLTPEAGGQPSGGGGGRATGATRTPKERGGPSRETPGHPAGDHRGWMAVAPGWKGNSSGNRPFRQFPMPVRSGG
jgi:hypothetical protein